MWQSQDLNLRLVDYEIDSANIQYSTEVQRGELENDRAGIEVQIFWPEPSFSIQS